MLLYYLNNLTSGGDIYLPILTNIKLIKRILEAEKDIIEKQSTRWVKVNEIERKTLKKGSLKFYFVDIEVDSSSLPYIYGTNDPFLVRDGDNLQLSQGFKCFNCYCTFVKSPHKFTLVFEDIIPIIYNGKVTKVSPSKNIERQIDLLDQLQKYRNEGEAIFKRKKYTAEINNFNKLSFHSLLLLTNCCQQNFDGSFNRLEKSFKDPIEYSSDSLTVSQKRAISEALKSDYFYLIHGPPGTGKTTVITDIVLNLVSQGKRVLICSWMNVAVDNVLSNIIKSEKVYLESIVRIGAGTYKVAENVQCLLYSDPSRSKQFIHDKTMVVGSTLASAYQSTCLIPEELFDVVIIDEAGAYTVTQTLLAISLAKKFILVGDHYQLPPILQVKQENCEVPQAFIDDFKISLFEKMIKLWYNHCTILDTQFRMEEKIAELANILVYHEIKRIKTGGSCSNNYLPKSHEIKSIVKPRPVDTYSEFNKLISRDMPVVWLHTEGIQKWEMINPNSYTANRSSFNTDEVEVVYSLYNYLMRNIPKLENRKIGIITTYRKQVEKLNEKFGSQILNNLEINTVDSFQGKEKDVIILSTVYAPTTKKRETKEVPHIFDDKRRFNVAFTRAKYKLIIVGDLEIIRTKVKYFGDIFRYIRDVYGDPNNRFGGRGFINDPVVLNQFLRNNRKANKEN